MLIISQHYLIWQAKISIQLVLLSTQRLIRRSLSKVDIFLNVEGQRAVQPIV
ncbi:hypothetical protein [Nostoc sp. NIES-3756]|uniref:hypothetical protein n=1 Tax=Nostoc sp. NIES-3756 TaxID=1751286 RepID=UPI000AE05A23|nr:hypothetical protein [Nostoc sp. NIES-3756]